MENIGIEYKRIEKKKIKNKRIEYNEYSHLLKFEFRNDFENEEYMKLILIYETNSKIYLT